MNQQEYIELFENARHQCERLYVSYSHNASLLSIQKQLDYLLALAKRETSDFSRLKDICIGVLTARELDHLGEDVEIFYQVQSAAKFFKL